jgi:hypothetical protein
MTTFLSVLHRAFSILKKSSEYDFVHLANGKKIITKPNQKYLFNIEAAVKAGRYPQLMLDLFIHREYMVDGGIIVCPASNKVLEIDNTMPENKISVIPMLNIRDIMADPALRALITGVPVEFLTELPAEQAKEGK